MSDETNVEGAAVEPTEEVVTPAEVETPAEEVAVEGEGKPVGEATIVDMEAGTAEQFPEHTEEA